ncbi:DNA mismatch repair protein MutT [Pseudomonas sp. A46]|uniref:NUDIX hydrolase n=1 Tax=Metapseudomonas furukawaii TaxID=1149133 RepID=UPI000B4A1A16|nr:NUDIX domain-containing protein [Pseudomonas sp. A46]OWJ91851.1 DNA mismatch repair protein MutT [Pseudomonas sp. A46]
MCPTKACPVVLRYADEIEILVFEHPLVGIQLVKGTIEPGESPGRAALRELAEESGLVATDKLQALGVWESGFNGQVWSFHLCEVVAPPSDSWVFRTGDDGGLDFRFFWHPLASEPSSDWHWVYRSALAFIRHRVQG